MSRRIQVRIVMRCHGDSSNKAIDLFGATTDRHYQLRIYEGKWAVAEHLQLTFKCLSTFEGNRRFRASSVRKDNQFNSIQG